MGGDEGVRNPNRAAARTPHARREPVIDDLDFGAGHHQEARYRGAVRLLDRVAHDHPAGEVNTAAEPSFTVTQAVTAGYGHRPASHAKYGGRQCARAAEDLGLGLSGEQRDPPGLY